MDIEQGLYAQVVMIHKKDSDNKNEKEKTKIYNFQGQSARSICWFDLDHEWLEETFKTSEPDLYEELHQNMLGGMRQKHINYL